VVDRSNTGVKRTDTPDKYGPDADKTYAGQSGSGAAKVDITSSFGKIILGEPNEGDMKEGKAKSKSKGVKEI
jgi:hypothetical protein